MGCASRQIDEAIGDRMQNPVVNVHSQEEQHHDALIEKRHHCCFHLRLRIENIGQRIAHLNAEHRARQLNRIEDQVGSHTHSDADQQFSQNHQRPIHHGKRRDRLARGGKQKQREGKHKDRLDARRDNHAAKKWRKEHQTGEPYTDGEHCRDDLEQRDLDHLR